MTPGPRISIILPVYNGEKYIRSALASAHNQTFTNWEMIVVDDGSTDATAAILAAAPPDPRRQVIHQKNVGLPGALNSGLAAASGDYLALLDCDDGWHTTYLARLCAALDAAPQAVLAFTGWRYMDEAGQLLPQTVILTPRDVARLDQELTWRNAILPSATVVRRQVVRQLGGFDVQMQGCQDWDLWLRLQVVGPFVAVGEALMWYRAHSDSMTESVDHIETERLKLNAKHLGPLDEPLQAWPPARRRAVGYTYFISALGHLRHKQIERAREKVLQAADTWPDLLSQDEFYYELGCAFQPRGVRGTAVGLSLPDGEALIRSILFEWLSPDLTSAELKRAWGQANMVLARVARATGQPQAARRYAARAIRVGTGRQRWRGLRTWARSYWRG